MPRKAELELLHAGAWSWFARRLRGQGLLDGVVLAGVPPDEALTIRQWNPSGNDPLADLQAEPPVQVVLGEARVEQAAAQIGAALCQGIGRVRVPALLVVSRHPHGPALETLRILAALAGGWSYAWADHDPGALAADQALADQSDDPAHLALGDRLVETLRSVPLRPMPGHIGNDPRQLVLLAGRCQEVLLRLASDQVERWLASGSRGHPSRVGIRRLREALQAQVQRMRSTFTQATRPEAPELGS